MRIMISLKLKSFANAVMTVYFGDYKTSTTPPFSISKPVLEHLIHEND